MPGKIVKVSGPTVVVRGMEGARMHHLALVGHSRLIGEIIRLERDEATIQVYEESEGLGLHEPAEATGSPLTAELGPGLLGSLYDGIQRPLRVLMESDGPFIHRGSRAHSLSRDSRWSFHPRVKPGDHIRPGMILGAVQETDAVEHRILSPEGTEGIVDTVMEGEVTVEEPVIFLSDGTGLPLLQKWPVRRPRPAAGRLDPRTLFLTGQRVFDTFFPLAEGGTAIVPGGFGTGKTVVQHSLARYAGADIIVYIGCGERGNEIAEVLADLPGIVDPRTGIPLINRTVIVANTSNMPLAAREASLYTGVTIAEYYRDQGYRVALMADSTSRWAEALREISSRLEDLPGEEGYPTYLSSRLSGFYERGGLVSGNSGQEGSVTMICSISPPGGDFSEPVTQASMRVSGALWALDSGLAHSRHFPAINTRLSYSLYRSRIGKQLAETVDDNWSDQADQAMSLLQKEESLQEVVQLVGLDAVPDKERIVLETSRMIRESFLAQSAFSENDAFCPLPKQYGILALILRLFSRLCEALEEGAPVEDLLELPMREAVARLKELPAESFDSDALKIGTALEEAIHNAVEEIRRHPGSAFNDEGAMK